MEAMLVRTCYHVHKIAALATLETASVAPSQNAVSIKIKTENLNAFLRNRGLSRRSVLFKMNGFRLSFYRSGNGVGKWNPYTSEV